MEPKALFEAQKDFEGIEQFISRKFGIPLEARIMTFNLNAANLEEQLTPEERQAMRAEAEQFIHSENPLDLKLPEQAEVDLDNPPKVVTLVSYIRNAAAGAMTHADEFGIGDSQAYRNRAPGSEAGIDPEDARLNDLNKPERFPVQLKNYIAMLSRQYLPGILRIAFGELGLMAYLTKIHPEIARYISMLPDATDPATFGKFSIRKLEFFGKRVIPAVVVRELLSRTQPGKFKDRTTYCDASTLAETRAYLGSAVADMFTDLVDTPDINLDANLADRDGTGELNLAELVDAMDIGEDTISSVINYRTKNSEGKELKFSADPEKDKQQNPEHFTTTSDDELECPAYKAGEWYVVQVVDENHSKHGWFDMPESPTGRFYFRGGPDPNNFKSGSGFGIDTWCIVKWDDYFNRYCNKNENDYAYYYVHETAPQLHDESQRNYNAGAFGVVYSGTENPKSDRYLGLARSNQDRGNNPAIGDKNLFKEKLMSFFPMQPSNQLTDGDYSLTSAVNNTIGMLCLIGKWDNSVKGDENIVNRAKELSLQWFPPKPGVETDNNSIWYATTRDIDEAAAFLSASIEDTVVWGRMLSKRFTVNLGDTQWLMIQSPEDKEHAGYMVFVPFDRRDDVTDDTPTMVFRYNPDVTGDNRVVPITEKPVTAKEAETLISEPSGEQPDVAPEEYDGMYLAPAFGGASGKRRVAVGKDGITLYAVTPDTDTPEPIGQLGGQPGNARHMLDRRATFFKVEGGYNVCLGKKDNENTHSPIKYIGFAREGKQTFQFMEVKLVLAGGTLLLSMPGAETLRLGNLRGNLMRQREDRYGAFLYIVDSNTVVDGVNLNTPALQAMAEDHTGDIGMVTISGDFMANLAGDGLVGTVDWFDPSTMTAKGQTRLSAGMLNRNAREIPCVVNI